MTSKKPTLFLIDGNAILHRAWHALPPLTTKSGQVVNAAYGFAMVLEKLLDVYHPDSLAVAWDFEAPTFRHEMYKEYKAHREEQAQELYDQIPIVQKILAAYGILSFGVEGFEADDVIATLKEKATKKDFETVIVSGDLDLLQLVDAQTSVLFLQKGISETKRDDIEAVRERYGLSPAQLVNYKALRGDPSDNLPGIEGIGEKGATGVAGTFGSVDGLLAALKKGAVPQKFAKKLEGQEKALRESRTLVELVRTVPLSVSWKALRAEERDVAKIVPLFQDLEFRTLLRKYANKIPLPPVEMTSARREVKDTMAVVAVRQNADLFGATISALAYSNGKDTRVIPNP